MAFTAIADLLICYDFLLSIRALLPLTHVSFDRINENKILLISHDIINEYISFLFSARFHNLHVKFTCFSFHTSINWKTYGVKFPFTFEAFPWDIVPNFPSCSSRSFVEGFCSCTSWRLGQKPWQKKCHLVLCPKTSSTNV